MNKIKEYRKKYKLTLQELADKLHIFYYVGGGEGNAKIDFKPYYYIL